jgi:hypothetical protein
VYLLPADKVSQSRIAELGKTHGLLTTHSYNEFFRPTSRAESEVDQMCTFACYELPAIAECSSLEGLKCTIDDFPVAGHATIHTTKAVAGEDISIRCDSYVLSPALESLPWKFVGYFLCPGAQRNPLAAADPDGEFLIKTLCELQDIFSLEQLESLRTLAAAQDYSLRALAARIHPVAALNLYGAALRDENASERMWLLGNMSQLVQAYAEVSRCCLILQYLCLTVTLRFTCRAAWFRTRKRSHLDTQN